MGAVATIGYLAFSAARPSSASSGKFGILSAFLVVIALCTLGFVLAGAAREPRGS